MYFIYNVIHIIAQNNSGILLFLLLFVHACVPLLSAHYSEAAFIIAAKIFYFFTLSAIYRLDNA